MDWSAFRQEFPVTGRWAYLDHAAVAPLTGRAQAVLGEWAADTAANGEVHWTEWQRRVEIVRQRLATLLNADPLDVAFVKNTTEGIGFVAEGFPWLAGDNLVTAADEYPSNLYPWMNLASRGVEVRRVASREGRILVDDVRAALDGRTRVVSLSFVEFATGFRNDVDSIGQLCQERGLFFFVDAIQGLGVLPLDVERLPIDGLAADGHKWLLGPEGAGLFWLRRNWVERLHPIGVGWNSVVGSQDFSTIDFRLKPHAGRWEGGSLNVAGIVALGASLKVLLAAGIPTIADRVLALTDHLCGQAGRAGLTVSSSRRPGEQSGILSLATKAEPRKLVERCRGEGIIVNHRAGRLRVSPHCYNTFEEIDRLLEVVRPTGGGA